MFHQCCYFSRSLLCCFIHYRSTGRCCGALLCCEEEIQLSEVLRKQQKQQPAPLYEDIIAQKRTIEPTHIELIDLEGEHCIWAIARLTVFVIRLPHNKNTSLLSVLEKYNSRHIMLYYTKYNKTNSSVVPRPFVQHVYHFRDVKSDPC